MIDICGEFDTGWKSGPGDAGSDLVVVAAIEGKYEMGVADVGFEISESLRECDTELEFVVGLFGRISIPEARGQVLESKLKTAGPERISIERIATFREVATFPSGVDVELEIFMGMRAFEGLLGIRWVGAQKGDVEGRDEDGWK